MSRAMKDSGIAWIGAIPKVWELRKAKNIFTLRRSKGDSDDILLAATQKFGMIPQNLVEGVVQVKTDTDFSTFKAVHINDFVISLRSFQGGFEMSDYKGVCSPAYQVFFNKIEIYQKFYKYLFKCYGFISQINAFTIGIREGKNIQYSDFSLMYLPFPNVKQQQAIANYLDQKCAEIDELIALQEKIIDELKLYKQSVITEAVTKGLNPNAPMKDSGIEWIGQIPEHWEIAPFKTTYRLTKGLTITKADLVENGIPVISYGQIHSKLNSGTGVSRHLIKYVPDNFLNNNVSSLVREGDIIFADTSEDLDGCGNCVYIDKDMTLFAGYHTIIAKNAGGSSNKYFAYLFKTDCWRYQLRTTVNGVKLFSISQKLLATTNVIIPSVTEQQQIAEYLDQKCAEIDEMANIKQQKIDELKEYKKSIIYEYVTGKKQVNIE